jgi:NAD-dependent dihydropyrimidine dehydrogenase PreA subunit
MGPEQGAEGLWTPRVAADGAGCEPSCNICGRVCPTGAIRALPLEEKRVARMGLAVVDEKICLPHAGREACQLCVDQCRAAGYEAIQFRQVHMEFDEQGVPDEETGFLAPAVDSQRCVGCGLCQSRCAAINVRERRCLTRPAIAIAAGLDKEDRLWNGSYRALRAEEQRRRDELRKGTGPGASGTYLPSFLE